MRPPSPETRELASDLRQGHSCLHKFFGSLPLQIFRKWSLRKTWGGEGPGMSDGLHWGRAGIAAVTVRRTSPKARST